MELGGFLGHERRAFVPEVDGRVGEEAVLARVVLLEVLRHVEAVGQVVLAARARELGQAVQEDDLQNEKGHHAFDFLFFVLKLMIDA